MLPLQTTSLTLPRHLFPPIASVADDTAVWAQNLQSSAPSLASGGNGFFGRFRLFPAGEKNPADRETGRVSESVDWVSPQERIRSRPVLQDLPRGCLALYDSP